MNTGTGSCLFLRCGLSANNPVGLWVQVRGDGEGAEQDAGALRPEGR